MENKLSDTYGGTVKEIYEGIHDVGLKCTFCKGDDFFLLVDGRELNVLNENCDWDTLWKSASEFRIECKTCGHIMLFNPRYFLEGPLNKSLRRVIKEKQIKK